MPAAAGVVLRLFGAAQFNATLAHELTHWTRHPTRLNRDLGRACWRDEGYAAEKLVDELGAAFISSERGLPPDHIEDRRGLSITCSVGGS